MPFDKIIVREQFHFLFTAFTVRRALRGSAPYPCSRPSLPGGRGRVAAGAAE